MRLKAEIKRRIARIEVTFADKQIPAAERLNYCALIHFVNGSLRTIGVCKEKAILAEMKIDPALLWRLR